MPIVRSSQAAGGVGLHDPSGAARPRRRRGAGVKAVWV